MHSKQDPRRLHQLPQAKLPRGRCIARDASGASALRSRGRALRARVVGRAGVALCALFALLAGVAACEREPIRFAPFPGTLPSPAADRLDPLPSTELETVAAIAAARHRVADAAVTAAELGVSQARASRTARARARPAAPRLVDLNDASPTRLQSLSGVGPALAARIVEARPFASVDDLLRVRGIGPATLERLRPHVTIGGAAAHAEPRAPDHLTPPPAPGPPPADALPPQPTEPVSPGLREGPPLDMPTPLTVHATEPLEE